MAGSLQYAPLPSALVTMNTTLINAIRMKQ
jgi:hypothetical protein